MDESNGPAAPASGTSEPEIPSFEELAADPEIGALLGFGPVVRKVKRPDGWTDELQRELIARLAATGNLQKAVWQMGKHATGAEALYKVSSADSFRAAWDCAIALGRRRNGLDCGPPFTGDVPGITRRRPKSSSPLAGEGGASFQSPPDGVGRNARAGRGEGDVLNEFGEYEDAQSLRARAEEARDNISAKLLRARRLYLMEISASPGKRAAFEILTELPVDWDKARRCEAQADEPWRKPGMREPDMLLTAEAGWLGAAVVHGPDKRRALQDALDRHRIENGQEPIDWSAEDQFPPPDAGEGDPAEPSGERGPAA